MKRSRHDRHHSFDTSWKHDDTEDEAQEIIRESQRETNERENLKRIGWSDTKIDHHLRNKKPTKGG